MREEQEKAGGGNLNFGQKRVNWTKFKSIADKMKIGRFIKKKEGKGDTCPYPFIED